MASSDLLLEIGHSLSHSKEYFAGTMKVHSHKIGDKTIIHHNHVVLKKIEKAIDDVEKGDSEDRQTVQLLNFDQIKLIFQDHKKNNSSFSTVDFDYYYQLRLDQVFDKLHTPPPQILTA